MARSPGGGGRGEHHGVRAGHGDVHRDGRPLGGAHVHHLRRHSRHRLTALSVTDIAGLQAKIVEIGYKEVIILRSRMIIGLSRD